MHKSTISLLLLTLMGVLWGCEEVVVLDLEENGGIPTIEAIVSSEPSLSYVQLSESVDFYEENTFPAIENATVIISDDAGNSWSLTEETPGRYTASELVGIPGTTYTLDVQVGETSYEATSTMPALVTIDSLGVQPTGFGDSFGLLCFYQEPGSTVNFYRFKVAINDTPQDALIINDDELNNGIFAATPMFGVFFESGDSVQITLESIDQPSYSYFSGLSSISANNAFGTGAPADPENNLSNGALGYFSAQTHDTASTVIP